MLANSGSAALFTTLTPPQKKEVAQQRPGHGLIAFGLAQVTITYIFLSLSLPDLSPNSCNQLRGICLLNEPCGASNVQKTNRPKTTVASRTHCQSSLATVFHHPLVGMLWRPAEKTLLCHIWHLALALVTRHFRALQSVQVGKHELMLLSKALHKVVQSHFLRDR